MDERSPGDPELPMSDEVLSHYLLNGDPLAANDLHFPDEPGGDLSGDRESTPNPLHPLEGLMALRPEPREMEE